MVDKSSTENGKPKRKELLATEENPFHFVDSGLDNVYLVGIRYFHEPDGRLVAEIPAVKQLMRLIAHDIVTSPADLSGKQIRFLRKRLGKKATEYCQFLGVEPETLSRIENEKQAISAQVQKLARLSYCVFSEDNRLVKCARGIFESIIDEIPPAKKDTRIILEMDSHAQQWKERKAA